MSFENVKDPYTALAILKWLEENKQKFFKDIQITDEKIVEVVNSYIEENKDNLKGEDGDTPTHRWVGTKLQFKNPDGNWGKLVDLKGPRGGGGGWFSGGSSSEQQTPQPGTINYNEVGQIESILKGSDDLTTFVRDVDDNISQVIKVDHTKTFLRDGTGRITGWTIS